MGETTARVASRSMSDKNQAFPIKNPLNLTFPKEFLPMGWADFPAQPDSSSDLPSKGRHIVCHRFLPWPRLDPGELLKTQAGHRGVLRPRGLEFHIRQ